MTSGDCNECAWPCPTYVWATSDDRDPVIATWDPSDDDDEPPDDEAEHLTSDWMSFYAACSCGTTLGQPIRPDESFNKFGDRWERHVMTEHRGCDCEPCSW